MAAATRVTFGRGSVEPGLEQFLTERNSSLKDIFDVKMIQARSKAKGDDKEGADEEGYIFLERPVVRNIISSWVHFYSFTLNFSSLGLLC